MRTIMVLNAKGGSGKTTLATNLAVYYALQNKSVVLADLDPQGSSFGWLKARPANRARIEGVAAWHETLSVSGDTDYVIMDAPSGRHGKLLVDLVRYAETAIIPVLPSPLDIRAAADFIKEVQQVGRVARRQLKEMPPIASAVSSLRRIFGGNATRSETRLAVVANRVREYTLAYDSLYEFLDRLKTPFLTSLRDTQNYVHAAERGLGLFELAPSQVAYDLELWEPLIKWLNSKRSLPRR